MQALTYAWIVGLVLTSILWVFIWVEESVVLEAALPNMNFETDEYNVTRVVGGNSTDIPLDRRKYDGTPLETQLLSAYENLMAALEDKYGPSYRKTMFSGAWELSDGGTAMENRLLLAIADGTRYVMDFTGLSITAGHDGLTQQAYPAVLQDLLGPFFKLAGIKLVTRNAGIGGNSILPYSLCLGAFGGHDADLVSWEMRMNMESHACEVKRAEVEAFIRTAAVLPRAPAVLIFDAEPIECDQTNGKTKQSDRTKGIANQILGRCGGKTKVSDLMTLYKDLSLASLDLKYLVNRYTCGDKNFTKSALYGADTKVGTPGRKPWHPGPKGHKLAAELLCTHFAGLLLNAFKRLRTITPSVTLESIQNNSTLRAEIRALAGGPVVQRKSLRPSNFCHNTNMPLQCEYPQQFKCLTSFAPVFDLQYDLRGYVTDTPKYSPYHEWKRDPDFRQWELTLSEPTRLLSIFKHMNGSWPIDRKWAISGGSWAGPLKFGFEVAESLTNPEHRKVTICTPNMEDLQWSGFFKNLNAWKVYIDDKVVNATSTATVAKDYTVTCFQLTGYIEKAGYHELKIEGKYSYAGAFVRLSHVILPV